MLLIPFSTFCRIIHAVTRVNKTAVFLQSFLNCASTQFYMKDKTFCIQLTEYVGLQVQNYFSSKITATCRPCFPRPFVSIEKAFPALIFSPTTFSHCFHQPCRASLRTVEFRAQTTGGEKGEESHWVFSTPTNLHKNKVH